jgi:NitT/TauT family transport system ATP-binding protein/sulfonate transport system ATP-binding protein
MELTREENKLYIENVSKSYKMGKKDMHKVIDNLSLAVKDNEFLVILGPGHCGKSVLLNIISGLEYPDEGRVVLDGVTIEGPNPKMGMVFQKTGVFSWLTVMENVELGPKNRGVPKDARREKAQKYIDLVGLQGFENARPPQLSGGMKQRVGIARAYTNDPEILIMDEPFGALDAQTRYSMEEEIEKIWSQEKRTIIFVTNNIEEALMLGDRIILLTECPARVKKEYAVDISRPRDMMSPDFLALRQEISANTDLSIES